MSNHKRLYKFLFATSLGTFLEFFDAALFLFAAAIISLHFFPNSDPAAATLATWGLFAISYLMRPLGAVFFGYLADVKSSRSAMVISMGLMAFATTGIGILPTYAAIGLWAPLLLLLCRILQSIAVSPEYNLPSVFIKNNQWCAKRFGLVSSVSASVTGLGMMSASWLFAHILANSNLTEITQLQWRLPFIIAGVLVGTLGIYVRWNLDESLLLPSNKSIPIKLVFSNQTKDLLQGIFIAGYIGCISYALFGFLIYQLQHVKQLNPGAAIGIFSFTGLLLPISSLFAGYLSDHIERQKLMLSAALLLGVVGYYLFSNFAVLDHANIMVHTCILLASLGFFAGSFPGYLADLFKQEYRYTGSFLAYNIGMSWVGGASPLLFISLDKQHYMLPPLLIALYSSLIILLLIKSSNTVTFGLKWRREWS